jgi:hypothetical protein
MRFAVNTSHFGLPRPSSTLPNAKCFQGQIGRGDASRRLRAQSVTPFSTRRLVASNKFGLSGCFSAHALIAAITMIGL